VLKARGFKVPDDIRQRVLECRDLDQFEEWTRRAVTAASMEEIFS
jgi:hypothetical protein